MGQGRQAGRRGAKRPPRLSHLLVTASLASGLSLSNFQLITSPSVSTGCSLVYDSQIPGCTMDDFTQGQGCAQFCRQGLESIQEALQAVCSSDKFGDDSSDTVLDEALRGDLVETLCRTWYRNGGGETTATETTTDGVRTSTISISLSVHTSLATVTSSTATMAESMSPPPSSSSSSSSPLSTVPAESTAQTSAIPATRTMPGSTSMAMSVVSQPTPVATKVSTSSPSPSSSSSPSETKRPVSGGGSPFDPANEGVSRSPTVRVSCAQVAASMAISVFSLLLR